MNLSAGGGVAVREFATASGPMDYALFVDKRFCGVIEAKPAGTTLSGFSEQAARYIADAPDFLGAGPRQRRLEYVASDTETLFRDLAIPANFHLPPPRELCGGGCRNLKHCGLNCGICRHSSPKAFVNVRSGPFRVLNNHWPGPTRARWFR
jgi:hypothetical protein